MFRNLLIASLSLLSLVGAACGFEGSTATPTSVALTSPASVDPELERLFSAERATEGVDLEPASTVFDAARIGDRCATRTDCGRGEFCCNSRCRRVSQTVHCVPNGNGGSSE